MLTERDYCDYDTCVALKKLGYTEKTLAYYTSEKFFHWNRAYIYNVSIPDLANSGNKKGYKHVVDAVSLWEAQKWLREEWGVHITIHYIYHLNEHVFGNTLRFMGKELRDRGALYDTTKYSTYEEALLEGIKEAVKILKEE